MANNEIYKAALKKYGAEAQTLMVFEEMAELQKELCKNARGKDNRATIAEEIADVLIMLEQMQVLHDCAGLVSGYKEEKLLRLTERLNINIESRASKRLTCDTQNTNTEAALNMFTIKNGTTVCNITENGNEISLYDLMRICGDTLKCEVENIKDDNGSLQVRMFDNLFDLCETPEGILAHFYTVAWAFSELREKLKRYEDTEIEPKGILALKKDYEICKQIICEMCKKRGEEQNVLCGCAACKFGGLKNG